MCAFDYPMTFCTVRRLLPGGVTSRKPAFLKVESEPICS